MLNNLEYVDLMGNECISQWFEIRDEIDTMVRIVTEKCGFCRDSPLVFEMEKQLQLSQNSIKTILDGQRQQIQMQETFLSSTQLEREKLQNEVAVKSSVITQMANATSHHLTTIAMLEEQLKTAKLQNDLNGILTAKSNETCSTKTQALVTDNRNYIHEIEGLTEKLQMKTDQLKEKEEEVRSLKAKCG